MEITSVNDKGGSSQHVKSLEAREHQDNENKVATHPEARIASLAAAVVSGSDETP
jgi:hypothetical protein